MLLFATPWIAALKAPLSIGFDKNVGGNSAVSSGESS